MNKLSVLIAIVLCSALAVGQPIDDPLRQSQDQQGVTIGGNFDTPPPAGGKDLHQGATTSKDNAPPWETRSGIEYAAKNFFEGRNRYQVCFRVPSGEMKQLNFHYDSAAQKRAIRKWVGVYIDQALSNPESPLGERLSSIDRDLANCREALDINPDTGRSRRLDNYDKALEIQLSGRSKRLDNIDSKVKNHGGRIDTLESDRNGNRFGLGWLTIWSIILTIGLIWGLFLRPRS